MFHLALRYLLKQRRRTLITVVSMILAVSMVTSVGLIVSSLQNMLIVDQTSSNGTWHYKLILSDTATDDQRQRFYDLASSPEVDTAGKLKEQIYIQMGDGAENYYGLKQLDDSAMELMPYGGRITSGRMPENENEIIISNCSAAFWNSTDPLGQTATFTVMEASDMTIVQTVNGEDAVITATESYEADFVIVGTFERFWASNAPNISEAAAILPADTAAEALYLRLTEGGIFSKRIAALISEAGLDSVVTVEAHNRYLRWILQGEDAIKYAFIIIFAVLTMAVLLVMMIVIKNSYTLSVVEKTDLYGILRCLNASGGQIRQFVIWEGILTWAAAVPFGCIAGAAVTVTDFMGSYIDKSGMDFYFASSHHVNKTPESYEALRQDLSQYSAITGMQEVYPIEYLLDVPEEKITEGYDEVWKQFYPVDRPFMNSPAYNALGDNLKTVEIIPVNEENFRELQFTGAAPSYQDLLTSGQVIFCQSEVFRLNGMMQIDGDKQSIRVIALLSVAVRLFDTDLPLLQDSSIVAITIFFFLDRFEHFRSTQFLFDGCSLKWVELPGDIIPLKL